MQLIDGKPVYSATDLVGFLACAYLTDLERAVLAGLVERPDRIDPELDRIAKRGLQHEQRFLADLEAADLRVTKIQPDGSMTAAGDQLRQAAAATLEAMRRGDDVIYQATFFDGRWRGHADFLRRVDGPAAASALGPWHYEAWDTKLARHVKGSAVLQLCVYCDLLASLQGRPPEFMHVALGGSAREVVHLRVADYAAYHRQVRRLFEEHAARDSPAFPPRDSRPDPCEHCEVCRWSLECAVRRRREDDLSLVAGITARQRRSLRARDVPTRTALAELALPLQPPLDGTSPEALRRVREQARIQVQGERQGRLLYELLEPSRLKDGTLEPERGLLSLPPPTPDDLFFDIEGDPFALDDGVDYLFGILEPGRPTTRSGPATKTAR
jgi:predicted RecB family nuclease